ncbi:glycosyltransferase family 4 protein [Tistrella mobilis]|uniref:glycosyltransferase family 4 protein n=1 Tax=Tistrella mobilis TaxID=171437 RepID=UPI00355932DE
MTGVRFDRPLRILQVIEATLGGAGRNVIDLAEGMAARGHQVTLVWSAERADGPFLAGLRQLGGRVETVELSMRPDLHPGDRRDLAALHAIIAASGPLDVLHLHGSKAGLLGLLAARRQRIRARVYTPHALATLDPDRGMIGRITAGLRERLLAARATRIIAVSEDERVHAREYLKIDRRRLERVANGIAPPEPVTRAQARTELGLPQDALVVGFVGRLVAEKGADRLPALAEAVRQMGLDPVWAVVGDGRDAGRIRAEAKRRGIDRMAWLGVQNGARAMAAFDLLVMPSRWQGLPYTLIEALHRRLPAVVMDAGGAREVHGTGQAGIVTPAGDVQAMAAAVAGLLADEPARRRMAEAAGGLAREYSVEAMVERTLGVYARALAQG